MIIPVLNEESTIESAILSAKQAGAFEIIIADGGSTDQSLSIAKQHNCQVVCSEPGRGIQQNRGAEMATGDILLFLHADCQLDKDGISQIKELGESIEKTFGGFEQKIPEKGIGYRLLEKGNAFRLRRLRMIYGDQGFFIARKLFEELGGFDEVRLMEDVAISQKLKGAGKPKLLNGPLVVGARRWKQNGVIRQTLKNWRILLLYKCGVSTDKLAAMYR